MRYFDHRKPVPATGEGKRAKERERFETPTRGDNGKVVERVVSASGDFTIFLWDPSHGGKKPLDRMLGNQKQVNLVCLSRSNSETFPANYP